MDARALYRLIAPTEWAGAPARYSFSTLKSLRECPLRWQLQRSIYGETRGFPERPSIAAITGKIIHSALDQLFRALGAHGLPPLGSAPFQRVLRELDLVSRIRESLRASQDDLSVNPRAAGQRITASERDLYNQVCRLFHPVYAQARAARQERQEPSAQERMDESRHELLAKLRTKGALSEVRLIHPTLPLLGIIDLLWDDRGQTRIVDFKTGTPQPQYREQVELYALLWWRVTGDRPVFLDIRHPAGTETYAVDETMLLALEARLAAELRALSADLEHHPCEARPGTHCRHCDVRALCDTYWTGCQPVSSPLEDDTWRDAELSVVAAGSGAEVLCHDRAGNELTLTFDEDTAATLVPWEQGEQLRVLSALQPASRAELQLRRGSEVFRRTSPGRMP